jgi:hypothetical protein
LIGWSIIHLIHPSHSFHASAQSLKSAPKTLGPWLLTSSALCCLAPARTALRLLPPHRVISLSVLLMTRILLLVLVLAAPTALTVKQPQRQQRMAMVAVVSPSKRTRMRRLAN